MDFTSVAKFPSNLGTYWEESAGDSYYCSEFSLIKKDTLLYVVILLLTGKGFIGCMCNKTQKSKMGPRTSETSTSIFVLLFSLITHSDKTGLLGLWFWNLMKSSEGYCPTYTLWPLPQINATKGEVRAWTACSLVSCPIHRQDINVTWNQCWFK